MLKFRQFLAESPLRMSNVTNLSIRNKYKNDVVSFFYTLDLSNSKKLFGSYNYLIYEYDNGNIFYVFSDNRLDLFITYQSKGSTMSINVVEKINNVKNFSFQVYSAILRNTKYSEIETGNALSLQNFKAHKNNISAFNIYYRTNDGDIKINNEDELDKFFSKNEKTHFVLKESDMYEILQNMYGQFQYDKYIQEFVGGIDG